MGHSVRDMKEGEAYEGVLWLVSGQVRQTKNGDPYWEGSLQDATGTIPAKLWDSGGGKKGRVKVFAPALETRGAVHVQAAVDAFQGNLQLNLSSVRPAAAGEFDPSWFSPRSRRPAGEMVDEFDALLASIRDADLKGLLKEFRDDPTRFGPFCQGPAAKSIHHAWVGGLLEHTLSLARNVDALAPNYPALDRDLLICACAFHDVGKTLEISSDPGFEYTTDGKLWGHIYMGARLVDRLCDDIPGFPEEKRRHLVHIVLSHQGDRSEGFGSAADPATPEAIFFHHLDNLDAKVQNCLTALERAAEAGEAGPFTNGRGAIRKGYYRVRPGGELPRGPAWMTTRGEASDDEGKADDRRDDKVPQPGLFGQDP
jgi:3'-5' exoribonuclease